MPQTSEPDDFESLDDLDSYGLDGDPACEDDDIDAIDAEGVDELSADPDDDEGAARAQGVQSTRPMLGISVAGKLDDARIHKFIDAELLGGWTADSVAAFLNGLSWVPTKRRLCRAGFYHVGVN